MKNLIFSLLAFLSLSAYAKPSCENEAAPTKSYINIVRLAHSHGLISAEQIASLSQARKATEPTLGRNEYTLSIRRGFARAISQITPQSWRQTQKELQSLANEITGQSDSRIEAIENTAAIFTARPLEQFPISPAIDDDIQMSFLNTTDGRTVFAHFSEDDLFIRELATNKILHRFAIAKLSFLDPRAIKLLNLREDKNGKLWLEIALRSTSGIKVVTLDPMSGKKTSRTIRLPYMYDDAKLTQVKLSNGELFYLLDEKLRHHAAVVHSSGKLLPLTGNFFSASQFAVSENGTSTFVVYEDGATKIYEFKDSEFTSIAKLDIPYIRTPGVLLSTQAKGLIFSIRGGDPGLRIYTAQGEVLAGFKSPFNGIYGLHKTLSGKVLVSTIQPSGRDTTIEVYDVLQKGKRIASIPFAGDRATLHVEWITQDGKDVMIAASHDAVAAHILDGENIHSLNHLPAPYSSSDGYIEFIKGAKTTFVLGSPTGMGSLLPLELFGLPHR